MTSWPLPGALRRLRRVADLSQRDLAAQVGVPRSTLAAAEAGTRDLPVSVLARAAEVAGARLVLVGADGAELLPMDGGAVRDAAGRLFPAHLDTRHGDDGWWGGPHRPHLRQPRYTFDLDRRARDGARRGEVPADHHSPERGDSLADRSAARRAAVHDAAARERERRFLAGEIPPSPADQPCTCPAGCEALLDSDLRVPHVDDCLCRCDLD